MATPADWRVQRDEALLALESGKELGARADAADRLCALVAEDPRRGPELVEALPRMLDDKEPEIRASGVTLAALSLDPEPLLPILASRVDDPEQTVRLEAVGRLSDLALPQARGALARALEDESFPVRFEAARGMAALQHSAGLEVLTEALGEADLRFRALGALGQLGDPRALPAVKRLFGKWILPAFDRTQAAGVLAKLGDPSGVPHLFKRAGKWWHPDRALAAELIGEVKAPGAWEHLTRMVADAKDPNRGAAARGLGRLRDARALPLLLPLLDDAKLPEDVRLDAAEGLCTLALPEAHERVRRALPGFTTLEARAEIEILLELYAPEGEK